MTSLLAKLLEQAQAFSPLEVVAVLLAIGYLLLAIRQNIWCWLCAGVSTAIYVWLFIGARLYMESVLNGFYFVMAIYGWYFWTTGATKDHERPVVAWPLQTHVAAIVVILAVSLVNGILLSRFTDAAFPYIDSLTTWSAIWATFLVARKVLENWWYWLGIDMASVFVYWLRDLQLTSLLFVIYVIMIPFGLVAWSRSMREQHV
ncbi:MAG: nicotinamide riboside transporter PnuC [Gammaproteobacteria bacterium]|nr:nicotinamide riboside transporter PnuC [Gammaproteobacteria bacterium]MBT8110678.1 nicotinamide riboside transporter PnuC [Gammaproteobacteria bacterium]NND48533.1 nicotinamide mononucleotide transporter [Woeseiaceae bacterium]NNL45377.1 nicotinamide mononucleotide transporter [Woeseiaceae bacterium]